MHMGRNISLDMQRLADYGIIYYAHKNLAGKRDLYRQLIKPYLMICSSSTKMTTLSAIKQQDLFALHVNCRKEKRDITPLVIIFINA